MAKSGDNFENLAKRIFDSLSSEESTTTIEGPKVYLEGKDGKREFDLVVRSKVAGFDLLTVVECRDYKGRLDVTHLDGFVSKMEDVNADKGVLVSRNGFSNKAKKKAERLGVSLCLAHDVDNIVDHLAQSEMAFPIVVAEIEDAEIGVHGQAIILKKEHISKHGFPFGVCDRKLSELLSEELYSGGLDIELKNKAQTWKPRPKDSELFFRDAHGTKIIVPDLELSVKFIKVCYYFGYLSQLPSTVALLEEDHPRAEYIFTSKDIRNGEYKNRFSKFERVEDIPKVFSKGWHMLAAVGPQLNSI